MYDQIGIIVMNYNEKIFVCEGGYFIRATVGEDENVEKIIRREIKYYLDIDMFRIVKRFDEKLIDISDERTIYLVEVGIYNNEFEFINPEKMIKQIVNTNYRDYLDRNLIKYDNNNDLASTILNLSVLFIAVDIIPRFIIKNEEILFLPLLGLIGCLYFIAHIFIRPKLINQLIKIRVNTTILITTLNVLMTLYCIRLFIMAV